MKRFVFPLQQIRSWNATRLQLEQTEREGVIERQRLIEEAFSQIRLQQSEVEHQTLHQALIDSSELMRIEQFRHYAAKEGQRLLLAHAEFAKQVAERRARIVELKRKIELLDRLRERQYEAWLAEESKELQSAADEAFLQKLVAKRL